MSRNHGWVIAVRSMWLARCGKRTPKWSVSRKPAALLASLVK